MGKMNSYKLKAVAFISEKRETERLSSTKLVLSCNDDRALHQMLHTVPSRKKTEVMKQQFPAAGLKINK